VGPRGAVGGKDTEGTLRDRPASDMRVVRSQESARAEN